MARGRESQIVGAATAKLREPKHVRTRGTNNKLESDERYQLVSFTHGGQPPRKPGIVQEFHIGQGKVREIVVCLWCDTVVAIVTKQTKPEYC